MNRRNFLKATGTFLGMVSAGITPFFCSTATEKKPNILFIAIDDLNDWIGCMGGHPNSKTPNLDRLAREGTLFTNAHCQAPICGPSRASLMTGLRPSTTGIYGQINDNNIRKSNQATQQAVFLQEYLRQNGYKTMAVGKIFHKHVPDGTVDESGGRVSGFGPKPSQRIKWDRKGTSTDWGPFPENDQEMPDYQTAQWAIERLKQKQEKPFFLAAGFLRPHVPWHVPQKWFNLHPLHQIKTPPYLPDDYDDLPEIAIKVADVPMMPTTEWMIKNQEWKNVVQAYLACVSFVDHYVGEVLKALKMGPNAKNTVVILWSDHGYHIGEKNRFAKHSIWERATRAPLLIAGPSLQSGQICKKPVGMIDLYPTILDLCGLEANPQNEGHSLTPLLKNPENEWPHAAVTTYGRNNHAVRSEHFRYIHYENGAEELYDHRKDQNEWFNLVKDPEYDQVKQELKKHLPQKNVPWSTTSRYDVNEYFTKQRIREIAD
jgi:arylsulfatase A-like enzyme